VEGAVRQAGFLGDPAGGCRGYPVAGDHGACRADELGTAAVVVGPSAIAAALSDFFRPASTGGSSPGPRSSQPNEHCEKHFRSQEAGQADRQGDTS
jgi:hypothetical protein